VTVNTQIRHGRTCLFVLHTHSVFVTTYRRGVLTGQHHDYLTEVFDPVYADFGAHLSACDGEDDHVHPQIEHPPTVQPSKLVNSLKGVSSRRLRQRFKLHTQRDHLWSPAYLSASCGGAPLDIIPAYIEAQRSPA
jgi:putative transposase